LGTQFRLAIVNDLKIIINGLVANERIIINIGIANVEEIVNDLANETWALTLREHNAIVHTHEGCNSLARKSRDTALRVGQRNIATWVSCERRGSNIFRTHLGICGSILGAKGPKVINHSTARLKLIDTSHSANAKVKGIEIGIRL